MKPGNYNHVNCLAISTFLRVSPGTIDLPTMSGSTSLGTIRACNAPGETKHASGFSTDLVHRYVQRSKLLNRITRTVFYLTTRLPQGRPSSYQVRSTGSLAPCLDC